jgi:hypothetical protein
MYLLRARCSHTETFKIIPRNFLIGRVETDGSILIVRRWLSNILDVRFFGVLGCYTDHCLVVAKVRESLAVSKQAAQTVDMERFNIRKLNELVVRKQCQTKISNGFTALENLNDTEDINRSLENIKEN